MTKTIDAYFRDWEADTFGFGYGTGEPHVIPALKALLAAIPERPYEFEVLELAVGPLPAWLLINALCRVDIFEYGSSPRYGWLTAAGERLKSYTDSHTVDELLEACARDPEDPGCSRGACNCGPTGYRPGVKCANPFWSAS